VLLTVRSLPFSGEWGNWCRIFVQMKVPLVPLSIKTFSERTHATTITGVCARVYLGFHYSHHLLLLSLLYAHFHCQKRAILQSASSK